MGLKGKTVCITGGNSGIGLAIAKHMLTAKAHVAIMGRDQKTLGKVEQQHPETLVFQGDVLNTKELDSFYKSVENQLGKIEVLIANAGVAKYTALENGDELVVSQVLDTNIKGTYLTCQRALPYLQDHGQIILMGSALANKAAPGFSIYAASKAAVRSLARSFSQELSHRNIRVNVLSPGATMTPLFDKMDVPQDALAKGTDHGPESIPLGKFAQPEDIAKAAAFLASDNSAYMQGAELVIDGGFAQI